MQLYSIFYLRLVLSSLFYIYLYVVLKRQIETVNGTTVFFVLLKLIEALKPTANMRYLIVLLYGTGISLYAVIQYLFICDCFYPFFFIYLYVVLKR